MPNPLPAGAPATLGEAFAHIGKVTHPTALDVKVMVLVEAAGEELYAASARDVTNPAIRDLLLHNGREEMAHAHRAAKAVEAMTGEAFPPPAREDNPYLTGHVPTVAVTVDALTATAQTEFNGENLYQMWADNVGNDEAARLFRLNGKEETDHGNRLMEAVAILQAA